MNNLICFQTIAGSELISLASKSHLAQSDKELCEKGAGNMLGNLIRLDGDHGWLRIHNEGELREWAPTLKS
jgi:hypothetical protein